EHAIVDRAYAEGWIQPQIAPHKTGKKVAVVGSGPAGLAAAQQLARVGHSVTLFEKNDQVGGLLRFGIPDFKLEKVHIDRRVEQLLAEGVEIRTNTLIGDLPADSKVTNWATQSVSPSSLLQDFDAVLLTGGAEQSRDLPVPGRELTGVHFAMEFLPQQNRVNAGVAMPEQLRAEGKQVIVIGGGDTGSDCVGTSNRQGAASVVQLEIMPKPPIKENKALTWPDWPLKLRTSSSHDEGVDRDWAVLTKRVIGENEVTALECVRVEWNNGRMEEVPGSEFTLKADLILLAMGFVGPRKHGMIDQSGVALTDRGNVDANVADYKTSEDM